MSRFIKVLRQKPSLTLTLRSLNIDSIDPTPSHMAHFQHALMKFLTKENVLESLTLRIVFSVDLISELFSLIETATTKIVDLNLVLVHYGHLGNMVDNQQCVEDIRDKWEDAILTLKSFHIEIVPRLIIVDELDPGSYNDRLFQQWREQLNLNIIDLTNDLD